MNGYSIVDLFCYGYAEVKCIDPEKIRKNFGVQFICTCFYRCILIKYFKDYWNWLNTHGSIVFANKSKSYRQICPEAMSKHLKYIFNIIHEFFLSPVFSGFH